MKTSIVMATYNGEQFLKAQLDSILKQTELPDQIIVVDDASTDGTVPILEDYAKHYSDIVNFTIIVRKKNVGYIANFIDGIQQAEHDLIFLCDQDDLWLETKIAKIKHRFEQSPDLVTLHTSTNIIDHEDKVLIENVQDYPDAFSKCLLSTYLKKINYAGMAMVFRRDRIESPLVELFEKTNLPTHDWTIGFLACLQDGFYTSNEVLTLRRFTGNNVALRIGQSSIDPIEERIEGIELYQKHYTFLKQCKEILNLKNLEVDPTNYIDTATIRIDYLQNKNLFQALKNMANISFYPSRKAYLKDLLLLIRGA